MRKYRLDFIDIIKFIKSKDNIAKCQGAFQHYNLLYTQCCMQTILYIDVYIHIATLIFTLVLQMKHVFWAQTFTYKNVTYFANSNTINNTEVSSFINRKKKVHLLALTHKHTQILFSMNNIHRSFSVHWYTQNFPLLLGTYTHTQ